MTYGCRFELRTEGLVPRLEIAGEIDMSGREPMRRSIRRLFHTCSSSVAIDLRGVTFMDSTGVQQLLLARDRAARTDRQLLLLHPSSPVERTLRLSGVWELFDVERSAAAPRS